MKINERSNAGLKCLMLVVACGIMSTTPMRVMAEDTLPSAEQLLDKYVEVTGGKAAYEKLTSQVRKGKMEIAPMGQTITIEVYNERPNKMAQIAESDMMGKTQIGCDGEHVWMVSAAMGGSQLMDGERAEQTMGNAMFNPELNWRERYSKVETVGSETIDGKPCYKVIRTPKSGEVETVFINKETNLIEMTQTKAMSPMGEIEIEITYDDYKKSGDITSAHKSVQKMAGMEQVITFDEIKYNVDIDPKLFTPPDDIKKQIEDLKGSGEKDSADKAADEKKSDDEEESDDKGSDGD